MELNDISLAKLQDFVQLQEETSHLVLDQFIEILTCVYRYLHMSWIPLQDKQTKIEASSDTSQIDIN